MSQKELENKFKELEDHILELAIKYIAPHTNPLEKPVDYNLDVHSFCILCHAAFEEFLEDVTLYSVDKIEREFNSKLRKFSFATFCFLHFDEHPLSFNDEKKWDNTKLNDYLSTRLRERKSELSKYAIQDNHGIDVKYMRKLLTPIGIDVPQNAQELASLVILKNIRGMYAHSFARNKKPLAPEDAQNAVFDVFNMVEKIKNKALSMSYYLI
ncbi:HEPN domain-containing protein [Bacteroides caccae]|jgi:hypothetical protein|uniref:HEPN domain-containing protein n=1 Tax=Bacteroides caccae TaxID=47678 RepID=UPI000E8306BF|nr:HEPN domain-containing protein [Bacteroides caccae]RGD79976.1 hypothetical protein DW706_10305 [Bacteroides caccae]